ncbi:MAG: endonuclease [Planctomycetaceae bacterium]|nr:endonuclease [Planctomycetaceae bacterium]
MSTHDFSQLLQKSFADQKLARAEKDELKQWLERLAPDAQKTAQLRNQAFAFAKEQLGESATVVNWLEDVVRLLHPVDAQTTPVSLHASFSPHDNCPAVICEQLAEAKRTVDICVFTITDDRISSAILRTFERGVKIRIITDNDKAADEGSDTDRLAAAGIPVRVDRTAYHMHHKFAIFDQKSLLNGSYNWTRGAAENNEENFVILDLPPLVSRFQQQFDHLWSSLGG